MPLVVQIDGAISGQQIISTINSLRRKTLIRIPHGGSRPLAAQALQKALDKVINTPTDLASLRHLLCLAYLCLNVPSRGKVRSSKEKSLTSKVNVCVRAFVDALSGVDLPAVIDFDQSPPQRKSRKPKDVKRALADRVAGKILEGDVKGAVHLTSSDDTLIPPNTETWRSCARNIPLRLLSVRAGMSIYSNLLQPNQLGFGIKRGAEAAIHAARTFIHSHNDMVLLKIDFANAINSINRDKALEAVSEHLPSLLPSALA